MCDQWKMLQCWWRTGNSPSFFVSTPGNLPYPEVKKVKEIGDVCTQANARGSGPDGGGVRGERLAQLALTNALYPQGAGHLNLAKTSSSKSNGSRCEQGIRYKPGLYIFQGTSHNLSWRGEWRRNCFLFQIFSGPPLIAPMFFRYPPPSIMLKDLRAPLSFT